MAVIRISPRAWAEMRDQAVGALAHVQPHEMADGTLEVEVSDETAERLKAVAKRWRVSLSKAIVRLSHEHERRRP